MVELEQLFGAVEHATRDDAAAAAGRLLKQNRAVFESYGPQRAHREGRHGSELAAELGLVHVTMLTVEEEADARFANEVDAVHVGGDAPVKP